MQQTCSLIIPAAGSGSRMGHSQNKLFIQLAGKPVLWHTLQAFQGCKALREIVLAIRPEDSLEIQTLLRGEVFQIPVRTVMGGETRQESVYNALRSVDSKAEIVWVHDGARPFISETVLEKLAKLPEDRLNSVVAVPAKDTVKRTNPNGVVIETPNREGLWLVQTPQVFRKGDLMAANAHAEASGYQGTDDASLMEWAGFQVSVVQGDYFNIKITTPEDLVLAEAILAHNQRR